MGTRATVHFQQKGTTKAIVYRHFDGYPDGLGHDLECFLAGLPAETRFDDPTSMAARFVNWLGNNREYKDHNDGLGIVLQDPGDIEYRYLVGCDGDEKPEVEVQSCWA